MYTIREEVAIAAINRAYSLVDYNIHNNIHKRHYFKQQIILIDESLTDDEKIYAIRELDKVYDRTKFQYNEGMRRTCENCNQDCLATLYCEYCVRNHLKVNFSSWSSGNFDVNNLVQKCQIETISPNKIIEWIPYNSLQNIGYSEKGRIYEIYKAVWIDGHYTEWDSKNQQLKRFGDQKVVIKKLENVKNASQKWFEEAKLHFTICSKWAEIVPCYGLTKDPSGNYMLVMNEMDLDLRTYLQQNHYKLTWKERIQLIFVIIIALEKIHKEGVIHKDLHSRNILYSQSSQDFYIDLGFCGPADRSSESIYGNLPYIAPEVISGKRITKASDIYSVAMLMWEISSGQIPFMNREHNYDLAMNIINGIRPKIASGTPLEYKNLMKQCWDADPLKRPDILTLWKKISEIISYYRNIPKESEVNVNSSEINTNLETDLVSSILFTSKVHRFENFPEPKNATEEEQEEFHSKSHDNFYVPDSKLIDFFPFFDDLDKLNHYPNYPNYPNHQNYQKNYTNQKKRSASKFSRITGIFKVDEKGAFHDKSYDDFYASDNVNNRPSHQKHQKKSSIPKISGIFKVNINNNKLSKIFKRNTRCNDDDTQNDKGETIQHQIVINIKNDEVNSPNFYAEEQDTFCPERSMAPEIHNANNLATFRFPNLVKNSDESSDDGEINNNQNYPEEKKID